LDAFIDHWVHGAVRAARRPRGLALGIAFPIRPFGLSLSIPTIVGLASLDRGGDPPMAWPQDHWYALAADARIKVCQGVPPSVL
jgi:hypothetical protein